MHTYLLKEEQQLLEEEILWQIDKRMKKIFKNCVTFKNSVPFNNCNSETYNPEIDNAKDINIVMPMYNLIEYSDNYSKTSGSFWQYYRDEPNDNLKDSEYFK